MAKMKKKSELPTKRCAACGRPFAWRKKWERDWDQVRFCSDACRRNGAGTGTGSGSGSGSGSGQP